MFVVPPEPPVPRGRWAVLFFFIVSYVVARASNWVINGPVAFIIGGVAAFMLYNAMETWKSKAFDDFLRSPVANVIFWTIAGIALVHHITSLDPDSISEFREGRFY